MPDIIPALGQGMRAGNICNSAGYNHHIQRHNSLLFSQPIAQKPLFSLFIHRHHVYPLFFAWIFPILNPNGYRYSLADSLYFCTGNLLDASLNNAYGDQLISFKYLQQLD